jgi:hypothetical protein
LQQLACQAQLDPDRRHAVVTGLISSTSAQKSLLADSSPGAASDNPRLTGGLPQQITVLVVTEIVAVRLVSAWTTPVLKRVPGVARVLAVVCGLAYRLGLEMKGVMMKAGRRFVGQSVLGCE